MSARPGDAQHLLSCRALVELLGDYLEAALPPDVSDAISAHLRVCDACQTVLDQLRSTAEALGSFPAAQELPESTRMGLLEAFRDFAR